jgi:hypothetical protein
MLEYCQFERSREPKIKLVKSFPNPLEVTKKFRSNFILFRFDLLLENK